MIITRCISTTLLNLTTEYKYMSMYIGMLEQEHSFYKRFPAKKVRV
jgi:hypothetical protein